MRSGGVSVIIPVKNAGRFLDAQLRVLFSQEGAGDPELLLIDSGSTDCTLAIAARYPARVISIRSEEFNHGETRNLGARETRGEFLVYLTQDALPADAAWLRNLCEPLRRDAGGEGR